MPKVGNVITQVKTTFGVAQLKMSANGGLTSDPADMFNSLDAAESICSGRTYKVVDVHGHVVSARIDIRVDGSRMTDRPSRCCAGPRLSSRRSTPPRRTLPPIKAAFVVADADIGDGSSQERWRADTDLQRRSAARGRTILWP